MAVSANRLELLQIADAVAREKSIDRMIVIEAMQDAIEKAARARYGAETEVKAEINPKTGELRLWRLLEVVEEVEEPGRQISLPDAKAKNDAAKFGDYVTEPLPPIEFGRIAAQSAKQVIVQKVRDAERDRMYDEYSGRIGEIVNGTVKRVEYGNVIVDLGRGEAIIRRDELIPREHVPLWRPRARLYLRRPPRTARPADFPQPHPSAVHGQAVHAGSAGNLRRHHPPSARSPAIRARRAKIAVTSNDSSIDPVGACVGMRGSRVQAVVAELQGEKIDIIPWTENIADLVVSALQPAEVAKVVLDEQAESIEVVVPDEQLSLAIGRRGQNVRLASQLIGWDIDILTEQEESRAPAEGIHRALRHCSCRPLMSTRWLPSYWLRKVSPRSRNSPISISTKSPRSRASTRKPQPKSRTAPPNISTRSNASRTKSARSSASPTSSTRSPASTPPCWWRSARTTSRRSRISPAAPQTIWSAGSSARTARSSVSTAPFKDFPVSREEAEDMIMAARLKAGWITEEDLAQPEAEEAEEVAEA